MPNKKNNDENTLDGIDKIIDSTFEKLKRLVDANTSIGSTIKLGEKKFLIPISKINVGVLSGGGEVPVKKKSGMTAGTSTGFSITPMGFVVVSDKAVDFVSTDMSDNSTQTLFDGIVSVAEKIVQREEEEK